MKSLMESLMMSDCQEIFRISIPMGNAALISCRRASMARPTVTTLTPATGAAASAMAGCPFMPVFGPPAVMFDRGRGTELWDSTGKRYLDFLTGLAVVSVGQVLANVRHAAVQRFLTDIAESHVVSGQRKDMRNTVPHLA